MPPNIAQQSPTEFRRLLRKRLAKTVSLSGSLAIILRFFYKGKTGGEMSGQNAGKVVRLKDGRTRQFRSKQERRQIVEEALKPGASVALVARAHGVNANQVFKWRRQYKQGRLEAETATTLLPVKVSDVIASVRPTRRRNSTARKSGIIDVDLGHARVRIEGAADPDWVRATIEGLLR